MKSSLSLRVCVPSGLGHVWLFATLWTVTCQAPLSMGFSRQEYWSGLPFPSPGDLPDAGIEPTGIHTCPLFWTPFCLPLHSTPLGCHKVPVWAPWVIQQIPTGYLFYIWWCMSFYATVSICPTLSFPSCPESVLYVCVSTAALQIGSSVPSF